MQFRTYPTASKFIAAVIFTIAAYIASEAVKPLFPEGTDFGLFTNRSMLYAFLLSWIIVGRNSGKGIAASISYGLTLAAVFSVVVLMTQGLLQMLTNALRNRYEDPLEAVVDIFSIGIEYAVTIAHPTVFLPVLVGALAASVMAEIGGRFWL